MTLQHHLTITLEQLRSLAGVEGESLVSILMPMHRAGRDVRQNPIRFKNALDTVEDELALQGAAGDDLKRRFAPLRELLHDQEFLQHQRDGLAIYIDRDVVRIHRVGVELSEMAVIGSRFHLAPLLAHQCHDGRFHIVVVSKGELHLLDCTQDSFTEVEFARLPASQRQAVMLYLEREKSLQFHTVAPAGGRGGAEGGAGIAMFHGHGGIEEDEKIRVGEYFQQVNRALHHLVDYRTPVVFAGVDYLFPIFRDAMHGINLVDAHVSGNFDEVRADFDEVHSRAAEIVGTRSREQATHLLDQYGNAAANGRASADVAEVVAAAHDGRVAKILINPSAHRWGTFNRVRRQVNEVAADAAVRQRFFMEAGHDDLVNLACVLAFQHGAEVCAFPRDLMPEKSDVAAIYRF